MHRLWLHNDDEDSLLSFISAARHLSQSRTVQLVIKNTSFIWIIRVIIDLCYDIHRGTVCANDSIQGFALYTGIVPF